MELPFDSSENINRLLIPDFKKTKQILEIR